MKYKFQTRLFQPFTMFFIGVVHCFIFGILLLNVIKSLELFSGAVALFVVIFVFTIIFYILVIGYLFQWAEYDNDIIRFRCIYLVFKEIKIKDVLLMSSFKDDDIEMLFNKIKEMHNNKNVYFVGMTNVGKSTIINKIIKKYTGEEDLITVSNTLNTTLENIYIPLNENCYIVDTPGLLNRNNLIYFLDKKTLEYITPKKYVKPKTFQLSPKQSLFIQGFVKIDFIDGERSSFVTNFSNSK